MREVDGFIRADSLQNVRPSSFNKLFEDRSFITTLEAVRDKLGLILDYEILNEQTLSYSERIYRLYKPMYDLQEIEGNSVFWMHPELAKLFDRSAGLAKAIADWQQRTSSDNRCYIVQLDDAEEEEVSNIRHRLKKAEAEEMGVLRLSGCKVDLYDAEDSIYFKVSQQRYDWQFVVCPSQHQVYISQNLLAIWGLKKDNDTFVESNFQLKYLRTDGELKRAKSATNTLERLFEREDTICLKFDSCQIEIKSHAANIRFCWHGESYRAIIPTDIAKVMSYFLSKIKNTFEPTRDLNEIRVRLAELGYSSPLVTEIVTKHEEYKTLKFGNVSVRQRFSDGFVSANDFYRPFGKDLHNWLKTDETFEFFKAVAEKEQLNCKYVEKRSSRTTSITACYPSLIERVNGSPKYGGGTWIHPLIALNLAQTISGKFAAEAVYILRDYYINKTIEKNHSGLIGDRAT